MRHFLLVIGSILGNFLLWALITILPIHQMIIIILSIVVGCLMIAAMVKFGGKPKAGRGATTKANI
jgi:hypothetical protein